LGYAASPVNDAVLNNYGFEFNLSGKILQTRDWEISAAFNGAHYTNRITRMLMDGDHEKNIEIKGLPNITGLAVNCYGWARGHSIYDYYMRDYAGVNPETGQAQWFVFYDDNNKNAAGEAARIANMEEYLATNENVALRKETTTTYSNATLYFMGKSAIPDLNGAFSFRVKYKNLSLNTQFAYCIGGYGYDHVYASLTGNYTPGNFNWHKDIENHWTTPGQKTDYPRIASNTDTDANTASTRMLVSMSYLALNSLRLEYDCTNLLGLKVWLSGDNLFYKTARAGYYPLGREGSESADDQYLPASTVMAGIQIRF
jgi:hypothetical protein